MQSAIIWLAIFMVALTLITKPLGLYMLPMCKGVEPSSFILRKIDRFLLKLFLIDDHEQSWLEYTVSLLFFNLAGFIVLYLILRNQSLLPFNPENMGNIDPFLAFNIAVSFVTNTNWQSYSGEQTLAYGTQMLGLTVQNFVSASTGIAVAFVLIRSLVRRETKNLGNFFTDLVRITFFLLLPLSFIFAIFLVSQGVIQSLDPYLEINTLAGQSQTIALGPVASQESIKLIGTNGGGFFNTNSAHPFENPSELTNFLGCLSVFMISASLTYTFGKMAGNTSQGWTAYSAMSVIFIMAVLSIVFNVIYFEQQLSPYLLSSGADASFMNMEGKEVRFDLAQTSLFTAVTTAASSGAVNNMYDSLSPLSSLVPILLILLGEVVFGGVGTGFYGVVLFCIMVVFISSLLVGKAPEFLGKKITPRQMKLACISMLVAPILVLSGTAVTCFYPEALESLNNTSAHGLSEFLFAWTSTANNNGSAFAGLNANTPFFNIGLGLAMWFGRFIIIISIMALAGSFVTQKIIPETARSLPTYGVAFAFLLICTILLVGVSIYIPVLALGPIAEHLIIWG